MKEAIVICDCGAAFKGVGHDNFEVATRANHKRARCRDLNPEDHAAMRQIQYAPINIIPDAPAREAI